MTRSWLRRGVLRPAPCSIRRPRLPCRRNVLLVLMMIVVLVGPMSWEVAVCDTPSVAMGANILNVVREKMFDTEDYESQEYFFTLIDFEPAVKDTKALRLNDFEYRMYDDGMKFKVRKDVSTGIIGLGKASVEPFTLTDSSDVDVSDTELVSLMEVTTDKLSLHDMSTDIFQCIDDLPDCSAAGTYLITGLGTRYIADDSGTTVDTLNTGVFDIPAHQSIDVTRMGVYVFKDRTRTLFNGMVRKGSAAPVSLLPWFTAGQPGRVYDTALHDDLDKMLRNELYPSSVKFDAAADKHDELLKVNYVECSKQSGAGSVDVLGSDDHLCIGIDDDVILLSPVLSLDGAKHDHVLIAYHILSGMGKPLPEVDVANDFSHLIPIFLILMFMDDVDALVGLSYIMKMHTMQDTSHCSDTIIENSSKPMAHCFVNVLEIVSIPPATRKVRMTLITLHDDDFLVDPVVVGFKMKGDGGFPGWAIGLICAVGGAIILLVVVTVGVVCWRRRTSQSADRSMSMTQFQLEEYRMNDTYE